MRIANNIVALNATNIKAQKNTMMAKSVEKLSSGMRINKASDDAAGLAISQKMRSQIRGLNQASRNAQDGISLIQTAEGAVGEMTDITQRMRELCVQAANGTLTDDDREKIQSELNSLKQELGSIADNTEFNTKKLLDGSIADAAGKVEQFSTSENLNLQVPSVGASLSKTLDVLGTPVDITVVRETGSLMRIDASHNGQVFSSQVANINTIDPSIVWQRSLGGSQNDSIEDVKRTNDGAFIITGTTRSSDNDVDSNSGGSDVWVARVSSSGNLEWKQSVGFSSDELSEGLKLTSDNGFVVVASTEINAIMEPYIVKFDSNGYQQWDKIIVGLGGYGLTDISETSSGEFYITAPAGPTGSDVGIIKTDHLGITQWSRVLGGNGQERPMKAIATPDGGVMISAFTSSIGGDVIGYHGSSDYSWSDSWLIKLDSAGATQWSRAYGGTGGEHIVDIHVTSDGGFIVLNGSDSSDGDVLGC